MTVETGTAQIASSTPEPLSPAAAIIIALLLVIAAYANSLTCGFVWDDNQQIVANYLIQDPRFLGQALRSDVWAFNAQRIGSVSNYWRPATVLWMVLNYQLFQLHPAAWHAMSVLLHAFVTVFVFLVVRQLGATVLVAGAAAWLFAVHPVHVESVSWCAASVDLQIAAGMLSAFWLYLRNRDPIRPSPLVLAALCYAFAMFSKETAILFPALVAGMEWILTAGRAAPLAQRLRRIALVTAPFVAVAVLYLVLRLLVAGVIYRSPAQALSWRQLAVFLPQGIVYYLRQSFFPIFVSPMNSLRPMPGGAQVWLWVSPPILVAAAFLALRLWRRDALTAFAFICFGLFLTLPLLNARACPPDERVHDRYLYVPVLGAIVLVAQRLSERLSAKAFLPFVAAVCFAFAALTVTYNRAWKSEQALWEKAVADCPTCSEAHVRLAEEYRRRNRPEAAMRVIEAGLAADPNYVGSVLLHAMLQTDMGDFDSAEKTYRALIADVPDLPTPYDQLAKALADQGRFNEAIGVFEAARRQFPLQNIKYGTNISIIAFQAGNLERAAAELEQLRDAIDRYRDPAYLRFHVNLGELYIRLGRLDDAIQSYQHYLDMTANATDPLTLETRGHVRATIDQLRAARR